MQFTDIKIILIICVILIIIDIPVLIYVNKDTYLVNFRNINNGEIDYKKCRKHGENFNMLFNYGFWTLLF